MTTPIPAGYPDFGRTFSEAQVLEVDDVNVTVAAGVGHAIRYVGNAKALFMWAQCTTNPVRVSVIFWADAAGTVVLDLFQMDMATNKVARQWVPVLGPYMSVSIDRLGGGGFTYTMQVWRTSAPGFFTTPPGGGDVVSQFNTPIGAASVIDTDMLFVGHTPISWNVTCTAASWQAFAIAVDATPTEYILDFVDNTFTPKSAPRVLYSPASTIRFRVHNFDGVAKNFFLFATRDWRV